MPAVAFSNNDIAVVAWTFDRHLDGCLGFAIHQVDESGRDTVLPALARFANQDKSLKLTTEQAPIQKFWWKDLFARRGGTYHYRIVPMGGTPGGALTPLADVAELVSNAVTLTEERPPFSAYFNRGIVATQALTHALNDKPSIPALTPHILDPNDSIRIRLMGQLSEGVTSLLDRADKDGGTIHAALYELNDPRGLEVRLQANPGSRNVILGNEQVAATKTTPASEDADAANRAALKAAGVTVIDRMLRKGGIPHNKFMVLSQNDTPVAVLSGSTNWTSTGLCTQTNNALVIESEAVAKRYLEVWNALKDDVDAAEGDRKKLQSSKLRDSNRENNGKAISAPVSLGGGVTVELMFSPNTRKTLASPPKEVPNDMQRVFDLIAGAKHAVLFLAFDPGNNSILDAAGRALAKNPDLFVRGALTSAQRASNFSDALHQGGASDQDGGAEPGVTVVGEPGKPKKKGAKLPSSKPDFRAVPAGAITANDAFGAWEAELAKFGFAIIHNKIVVIDPFSADCTVVTGSHNLGFRASHNNDENMLIIRGHRGLAEAYACHVLDLYDHYAFRFLLSKHPDIFGRPLQPDDTWQERYIVGAEEKSPELRFWLSAATGGGATPPSPTARRRTAAKKVAQRTKKPKKTASTKKPKRPAKKAAGRRTTARAKSKRTAKPQRAKDRR
ncbi:MAG TPA: phospholipase D-like domain-containing protein [Bradyrhizobium sp.]|nr:phospholipase D-like domain-containing protein [Bradyrhizobium sp.]